MEDDVPEEVLAPGPSSAIPELDSLELAPSAPHPSHPASSPPTPWAQPGVATAQYPNAVWQQHAPPPEPIDWTTSFHGLSARPFSKEAAETLMRPLTPAEIEIKPG